MDTGERSASGRRGVRMALAQVGLAGVVGAIVAPLGAGLVFAALFAGPLGLPVVVVVILALIVVGFSAVAAVAPEESWLTGNRGGRVFWALLVGCVGVGLWLLGWNITDEAGLGISRSESLWVPAGAVPFVLVAGMLLRRWYLALGSLAVAVVVGLLLLRALAAALPSDVDQMLAHEHVSRGSIMVTSVPGYHVVPQQGSWQLEPDDAVPDPPSPYLNLYLLEDAPSADCQVEPHDSKYPNVQSCEVDSPGLFYLKGVVDNAYVHRVDGKRLVLTGPESFDRAVLRDAVLAAHETDPPGSATTTVPGYTATSVSPQGTTFTPDDRSLLPGSRSISVRTALASTDGQCGYGALACEVEPPELRYERYDNDQYYVRTAPGREVSVQGGQAVDRTVLRTAALTAHQATDDDLRLVLRPVPPSTPDRSVMAGVRELARALYGTW